MRMEEASDRTVVNEFAQRTRRRAVWEKCFRASVFVSFLMMVVLVARASYPLWPAFTWVIVILVATVLAKIDWRCPSCRHFLPVKGEPLEECPRCLVRLWMVRTKTKKASSQAAAVIDSVGLARLEPPKSFIESSKAFSNRGEPALPRLDRTAKGRFDLAKTFGRRLEKATDLSMSDDGAAGPPRAYQLDDCWRLGRRL